MKINLSGKQALVGGSSRGIGKAIAIQLAESGASVTLMARSEDRMREIVQRLPTDQGQAHQFLSVDFTAIDEYQERITDYLQSNTVDILINNTQGPEAGGALEKTVDDYQKAFDLLFKSVVFTTNLVIQQMQENQWGRIVNVASISVKEPLNYLVLSNAIRAAVVTWAKSLSADVAIDGITVNNILTGYFDTERITQLNQKKAEKMNLSPSEVRAAMEEQVPAKRIGKPEEYAYLVAFLSSDKAAYINGVNIPIDGGLLKSL